MLVDCRESAGVLVVGGGGGGIVILNPCGMGGRMVICRISCAVPDMPLKIFCM